MRETYSDHADGRLQVLTDLDDTPGNNPPVTLRFLSRSYNYDQVGRVTNGFGTGSGVRACRLVKRTRMTRLEI